MMHVVRRLVIISPNVGPIFQCAIDCTGRVAGRVVVRQQAPAVYYCTVQAIYRAAPLLMRVCYRSHRGVPRVLYLQAVYHQCLTGAAPVVCMRVGSFTSSAEIVARAYRINRIPLQ